MSEDTADRAETVNPGSGFARGKAAGIREERARLGFTAPPVATIGVSGPVQIGKSIVMLRLKEVLEAEFGATVVLNKELRQEANSTTRTPQKWEREMVAGTVWVLCE